MALDGQQPDATAIGRVVAANENGIRFAGSAHWANYSKFAVGIVPPQKGDIVSVTFDRQGFVRAIVPSDETALAAQDGRQASRPLAAHDSAAASCSSPAPASTKDRTITRLAVLKAAAEYAASKNQSSSGDVLKIAACWERWVLRSDEPTDDLVDAF